MPVGRRQCLASPVAVRMRQCMEVHPHGVMASDLALLQPQGLAHSGERHRRCCYLQLVVQLETCPERLQALTSLGTKSASPAIKFCLPVKGTYVLISDSIPS